MPPKSPGERLNRQRIDVLQEGLRAMARTLQISAAYLTDIEKNRRVPSDELLLKICAHYKLDESELRAAWQRADTVVGQVATQDALTAKKVPQFLRTARNLSEAEWDQIITHARRLATKEHADG